MKEFIQPIIDLVKSLITPQNGSKFLITAIDSGLIYLLVSKSAELTLDAGLLKVTVVCLAAMPVVYYIADFLHKKHNIGSAPVEGETK